VAYLRTIASPGVKRRARLICKWCKRRVFAFEPQCPCCGGNNAAFDESLFEALAKSSLREALHWCESDRAHAIERIAMRELGDLTLRYCAVCGKRLKGT
jgi:hypothetical protein